MLSKIKTLAAALHLREFTVEALAERAGVPVESARTALNRCREGWFEVSTTSLGTRGGQPRLYKLTEEGVQAIGRDLGQLPTVSQVAPTPKSTGIPLGLRKARADLRRYADAPPEGMAKLAERISANLDWADRELTSPSAPQNDRKYRTEVAALRQKVEQLAASHEAAEDAVASTVAAGEGLTADGYVVGADGKLVREELEEVEVAEAAVALDGAVEDEQTSESTSIPALVTALDAARVVKAARLVANTAFAPRLLNFERLVVLVGAMTPDEDSKRLAYYVKGVLDLFSAFVSSRMGEGLSMVVDYEEDSSKFWKRSAELLLKQSDRDSMRPIPRLFMCMNSSVHSDLGETLKSIGKLPHLSGGIALADSAERDAQVERFAKEHSYTYKPLANPGMTTWLQGVMASKGGRFELHI